MFVSQTENALPFRKKYEERKEVERLAIRLNVLREKAEMFKCTLLLALISVLVLLLLMDGLGASSRWFLKAGRTVVSLSETDEASNSFKSSNHKIIPIIRFLWRASSPETKIAPDLNPQVVKMNMTQLLCSNPLHSTSVEVRETMVPAIQPVSITPGSENFDWSATRPFPSAMLSEQLCAEVLSAGYLAVQDDVMKIHEYKNQNENFIKQNIAKQHPGNSVFLYRYQSIEFTPAICSNVWNVEWETYKIIDFEKSENKMKGQRGRDILRALCLADCLRTSRCVGFVFEPPSSNSSSDALGSCALKFCEYTKLKKKTRGGWKKSSVQYRPIIRWLNSPESETYHFAHHRLWKPTLVPRPGPYVALLEAPPSIIVNSGTENEGKVPFSIQRNYPLIAEIRDAYGTVILQLDGATLSINCFFREGNNVLHQFHEERKVQQGQGKFVFDFPAMGDLQKNLKNYFRGAIHVHCHLALPVSSSHLGNSSEVLEANYSFVISPPATALEILAAPKTTRRTPGSVLIKTYRGSDCAALLRDNEFCLDHFSVRTVAIHAKTKQSVPVIDGTLEDFMVKINVSLVVENKAEKRKDILGAYSARNILTIVAGSVSPLMNGEATFTNFVLRLPPLSANHPPRRPSVKQNSTPTVVFTAYFPTGITSWTDSIQIPFNILRRKGSMTSKKLSPSNATITMASVKENTSSSELLVKEEQGDKNKENVDVSVRREPIAVSIPVHECIDCVHRQLKNVALFVNPSSLIVLHVAKSFVQLDISSSKRETLNKSHPLVIINPRRMNTLNGWRLHFAHALNIQLLLQWNIRFSHVLFFASNEMFVRHGVGNYIRRFDTVEFGQPPTASDGFLFEHFLTGMHLTARNGPRFNRYSFKTAEEIQLEVEKKYSPIWSWVNLFWWWAPFSELVLRDHFLARRMAEGHLYRYPVASRYMEGTYFSRELSKEYVAMLSDFDETLADDPMPFPTSEVYLPTLLQNICRRPSIQCGSRVSTMVWGNKVPHWTVTVADVKAVQCSPFEVPFALKRIPRHKVSGKLQDLLEKTLLEIPTVPRLSEEYCDSQT